MGAAAWVLIVLVILAVVLWLSASGGGLAASLGRGSGRSSGTTQETLRYRPPRGQDAAAVIATLAQHDFEASLEMSSGDQVVVVPCPRGRAADREGVRRAIGAAGTSMEDPSPVQRDVTFEDEQRT